MTGDGGRPPEISPRLLALFGRYGERYLARHFHAVRLSRARSPEIAADAPLIVYLNHPSWWDPMVCLQIALRLFPERRHHAPIEAAALERYRFFARLGFFGVEAGTARGARGFLETGRRILERPDAALWITAGGRFCDPRERPVRLRSGLGHLLRQLERATVLPLALEYPFWEERFPEALARFGEEVLVEEELGRNAGAWTALLESRLEAAQDALAAEALARDPETFESLVGGSAGVGGLYDLWRRLRAKLRGEAFRAEHGSVRQEVKP